MLRSWLRARRSRQRPRALSADAEANINGAGTVRLDFGRSDIWLRVTSEPERRWRAKACAKEPWTIDWLLRDVRPHDVLYDIGANVGAFSLIAACHLKAFVVAFEPGYANFARLCENIQLNGCARSIAPLPIALADVSLLTGFEYRTLEPGQSRHRLHGSRWATAQYDEAKYVQPVATMLLDRVVSEYGLPTPNHLKVDVDGAELRVLRGAEGVLRRRELRTVLIEIGPGFHSEVSTLFESAGLRAQSRVGQHKPGAPDYLLFART